MARKWRQNQKCRWSIALATSISLFTLLCVRVTAAPVSFQQAVNDYKVGNFAKALPELQAYGLQYPDNALVHYYIGLCHQGLNHLDQAKKEFQWVSEHGDVRLRPLAQAGLQRLSRVNTHITYGSRGGVSSTSVLANAPQTNNKIRRVIEFYADW